MGLEVSFGVGDIGGSASTTFSHSWGQEKTTEASEEKGVTFTTELTVPPFSKKEVLLSMNRVTIEVRVDYDFSADGWVVMNYASKHNGHHFFANPIESLGDRHRPVSQTVRIDYGFDAESKTRDLGNNLDGDFDDEIAEAISFDADERVGEIKEPNDVDMYRVTAAAGQQITFNVDTPNSDLDPYLRLFNRDGNELCAERRCDRAYRSCDYAIRP